MAAKKADESGGGEAEGEAEAPKRMWGCPYGCETEFESDAHLRGHIAGTHARKMKVGQGDALGGPKVAEPEAGEPEGVTVLRDILGLAKVDSSLREAVCKRWEYEKPDDFDVLAEILSAYGVSPVRRNIALDLYSKQMKLDLPEHLRPKKTETAAESGGGDEDGDDEEARLERKLRKHRRERMLDLEIKQMEMDLRERESRLATPGAPQGGQVLTRRLLRARLDDKGAQVMTPDGKPVVDVVEEPVVVGGQGGGAGPDQMIAFATSLVTALKGTVGNDPAQAAVMSRLEGLEKSFQEKLISREIEEVKQNIGGLYSKVEEIAKKDPFAMEDEVLNRLEKRGLLRQGVSGKTPDELTHERDSKVIDKGVEVGGKVAEQIKELRKDIGQKSDTLLRWVLNQAEQEPVAPGALREQEVRADDLRALDDALAKQFGADYDKVVTDEQVAEVAKGLGIDHKKVLAVEAPPEEAAPPKASTPPAAAPAARSKVYRAEPAEAPESPGPETQGEEPAEGEGS